MIRPGCRHHEGAYHDCDYVDARNRRIATAEAEATAEAGPEPIGRGDHEAWRERWELLYRQALRRLEAHERDPMRVGVN